MGGGTDKKLTPDSLVASQHVGDAVAKDPGTSTRTQGVAGPNYTGDAYIDHGAGCTGAVNDPACFLPPENRRNLVEELTGRISDVGQIYQRACDVVRLERMMTPATQPNLIVAILFDVLIAKWTGAIGEGFVTMKAAMMARAHALELDVTQLGISGRIAAMDAQSVNAKLTMAMTKVKGIAAAPAGSSAPTIAQSFLNALKLGAAVGFTHLRETLPAVSTDLDMIAFREAFAPVLHPQEQYEKWIDEKVERYLASGVAQIGRAPDSAKKTNNTKEDIDPFASVDTRVAYARFASGFPPRLFYQHASSQDIGGNAPKEWAGADTQKAGDTKMGSATGQLWVPDEFTEIALQRHFAAWGGLPPLVDIDDSEWYWEPARIEAAKKRKADAVPRPHIAGASPSVPKLQLPSGAVTQPTQDFSPKIAPQDMIKMIGGVK